jgi:hypothetical protein
MDRQTRVAGRERKGRPNNACSYYFSRLGLRQLLLGVLQARGRHTGRFHRAQFPAHQSNGAGRAVSLIRSLTCVTNLSDSQLRRPGLVSQSRDGLLFPSAEGQLNAVICRTAGCRLELYFNEICAFVPSYHGKDRRLVIQRGHIPDSGGRCWRRWRAACPART